MAERVAIITGAAGNLGRALARAFRDAGVRTVLADRSAERMGLAYPDLADTPDHLLAPGIDLANPDAVDLLVGQALGRFGRIDVLVNNAGGFAGGKPVHEDDLATWDAMFGMNLRPSLLCCRAVVPVMLRQRRGRIVNIGAGAALSAPAGLSAYAASKAAVLRLTESLAAELRHTGITVNSVLPGIIDTPENRAAMPGADVRTWVAPAAIADVILFLASDAARAVTGAAVPVPGAG